MAKKLEEGVWRTIGGRRVFIRTGQSLKDAMKESGKFKVTGKIGDRDLTSNEMIEFDKQARDIENNYLKMKMEGLKAEYEHAEDKYQHYKFNGADDQDRIKYKKLKDEAYDKYTKAQREYDEARLKEDSHFAGGKLYDKGDYSAFAVKGKEYEVLEESKSAFGDKIYKVKDSEGNIQWKDAKYLDLKKPKTGNDYLPKASKIETSGTSNRKEVSDNIQAHILSYYENPVDFMEEMDHMDYYPTKWHAGQEMAKGGNYLIYNDDISNYLNSLNINPKGKTFSSDRSFEVYSSLIGRESERLYNRMQKLYEQYKKEHKGSNVTLNDFRKWFK